MLKSLWPTEDRKLGQITPTHAAPEAAAYGSVDLERLDPALSMDPSACHSKLKT